MAKFNLQEALKGLKDAKQEAAPRPCPKCGEHDADGPCYGYDCSTYEPDFDCSAEIPQECDTCLYIACEACRVKLVSEILPDHVFTKKGGHCKKCGGPVGDTGCPNVACLGQPFQPNGQYIEKEALYKLIDAANAKWDCASTNAAMRELMTSIELMLEKGGNAKS